MTEKNQLIKSLLKEIELNLNKYEIEYQSQIDSLLRDLNYLITKFGDILYNKKDKVETVAGDTLDVVSSNVPIEEKVKKVKANFEGLITDIENDIISLKEVNEKDHLTQIYNRRYFDKKIEDWINAGEVFSLMMIDIDHFKNINDTYGHNNGDKVLIIISKIISTLCRDDCIPTRYGGEEFAILYKRSLQDSILLAENIRKSIGKNILKLYRGEKIIEQKINVTISVGVAQYEPKLNKKQLIEKADGLLYKAKNNGRNRVEYDR